jgi:GTP-binding protein
VDLPGYGYAKVSRTIQEAWWVLVEEYLLQRVPLRGVVHLMDARHEPTEQDRELGAFLAAVRVPYLLVLTKADKVPRGRRAAALRTTRETLGPHSPEALFFSAETGEGVPELWQGIDGMLAAAPRGMASIERVQRGGAARDQSTGESD